jgi:proteasome lid subunit RPN8/RPN11
MTTPLPLRQPIPLGRSIRWVPAGSRTPPGLVDLEDEALFIAQHALRDIVRTVRGSAGEEILGFLLGERYECPDSGAHYAVITTVVATGHVIAEEEPVQIPNEEWLGIQLEVRRRRLELIGWYHTAPFVGPNPSRLDLDTQRERFPEPWQCGLVIANGRDRAMSAGGFFRASTREQPSGAFVPFHELLDDASMLADGTRRTLIRWRNYTTGAAVVPDVSLDHDGVARAPSGPSMKPPSTFGAVPVLIPSRPEEDELPEAPPPQRGPERRSWTGRIVATSVLLLLVAGGILGWPSLMRTARTILPPRADSAVSHDTLAGESSLARQDSLASQPAAQQRAEGGEPVNPSVNPPAAVAPAPAGATTPNRAPARFDSLAAVLDQAIASYHARRTDFGLHRIDCAGLARGYRAADDALVALASLYRDARASLSSAQATRYQTLGASMEMVNTDFDASKCPRP